MFEDDLRGVLQQALEHEENSKKNKDQMRLSSALAEVEEHHELNQQLEAHDVSFSKLNERLHSINQQLEGLDKTQNEVQANPALINNPDYLQRALTIIENQRLALQSQRQEISGKLNEIKQDQESATVKKERVRKVVQGYMGNKEFAPAQMEQIWSHVEAERRHEQLKEKFLNLGKYEANIFAYDVIKKEIDDTDEYDRDLSGRFPALTKDPAIYNAFLSGIEARIRQIIADKRFGAVGFGQDELLTDEQIDALNKRRAKIQLDNENAVVIWNEGAPLVHKQVPEKQTELTENEQSIVAEAIKDHNINKNALQERLAKNEHIPVFEDHVLAEAESANSEHFAAKLAERTTEANERLQELSRQEALLEQQLQEMRALIVHLQAYPKLLKQQNSNNADLELHQKNVNDYAKQIADLQNERAKLPVNSKLFGFGGGVKDKKTDQNFQDRINNVITAQGKIQTRIDNLTNELTTLNHRLEQERQAIVTVKPDLIGPNGELSDEAFKIEHFAVQDLSSEIDIVTEQKKTIDLAKKVWSENKYLTLSLDEMQFVVSEDRKPSEIDTMAQSVAGEIIHSFYRNYGNTTIPDTIWSITNGQLNKKGSYQSVNVGGGDWAKFANLQSKVLNAIVNKKVIELVTERFRNRASGIRLEIS